ncbi:MAG: HAD hydrolase family protein [Gammaproteobacteria bacterium]|jgi:3-deoxy-D-manno-octulosonate 8-phosphate phosphatase (KDO 8-P phosphatase)|nr:HAD hydrolase family protein [Gammaproteobacteria bacterium]
MNLQTRLVLFDVDGVLTDGTLWVGPQGEAVKGFNVKDGVAVALLQKYGMHVGIVSGKASAALDARVAQLKFDVSITGCSDKLEAINIWLTEQDYGLESVVFVGDDVIDVPIMQAAGSAYAPADAHALAMEAAQYITRAVGGGGVAREVAEHILLEQGIGLEEMYSGLFGAVQ